VEERREQYGDGEAIADGVGRARLACADLVPGRVEGMERVLGASLPHRSVGVKRAIPRWSRRPGLLPEGRYAPGMRSSGSAATRKRRLRSRPDSVVHDDAARDLAFSMASKAVFTSSILMRRETSSSSFSRFCM